MKTTKQINFSFLILVIMLCFTAPTSSLLANAIPVEKNVQQVNKKSFNNKKSVTKKGQQKQLLSKMKTINQQQKQSYYGLQGLMIFFIILIAIFAAAIALFIAGLVLNISAMWIPALVLISIPLLIMLFFFLIGIGRKKKTTTEDVQ